MEQRLTTLWWVTSPQQKETKLQQTRSIKISPARRYKFIDIDSKVEALLGSGHIQTWQGWGRTKYGAKGQPLAMETAWGWTIAGLAGTKDSSGARVAFLSAEDQLKRQS